MQRQEVILRCLLYVATSIYIILLVVTVALWLISQRNMSTGSPMFTFAKWGYRAHGLLRTIEVRRGAIITEIREMPSPMQWWRRVMIALRPGSRCSTG